MVKIASIGDCCVDVYPKEKKYILGGTAFNRAKWLAQNNARVSLISAIGSDNYGRKYLSVCKKLGINTDYLTVLTGQTSQVKITLNKNRSPEFSEWDLGVLKNFTPKKWPQDQDALITTGLKPIKQLLNLPPASFTAADFDGETPYTFNQDKIQTYSSRFDLVIASRQLTLNHPMFLETIGGKGSRLFTPGKIYTEPAITIKTADTTGAGDVYISGFILNYLQTKNIPLAMKQATQAAAKAITAPRC